MNFINNLVSKIKYDSELKEDLFKIGTMLAVSRVYKDGDLNALDNKKFLMETGFALLGFAVWHLLVKDYAKKVKVGNHALQKLLDVAMKVGTVTLVPALIKGQKVNLYSTSYLVSGFLANALLKDCINLGQFVDDMKMKKVADDLVVAFFITVVPRVVRGGRVTPKLLQEVLAKAAGFGFYDYFLA